MFLVVEYDITTRSRKIAKWQNDIIKLSMFIMHGCEFVMVLLI